MTTRPGESGQRSERSRRIVDVLLPNRLRESSLPCLANGLSADSLSGLGNLRQVGRRGPLDAFSGENRLAAPNWTTNRIQTKVQFAFADEEMALEIGTTVLTAPPDFQRNRVPDETCTIFVRQE
jgi:hypothetical protein